MFRAPEWAAWCHSEFSASWLQRQMLRIFELNFAAPAAGVSERFRWKVILLCEFKVGFAKAKVASGRILYIVLRLSKQTRPASTGLFLRGIGNIDVPWLQSFPRLD
jgi:hypothetical protein